jgi:hypothetical protein
MTIKHICKTLGLMLATNCVTAGEVPLGIVVGTPVPLGLGGVAAIAAVSLIIGTQLIKRRK